MIVRWYMAVSEFRAAYPLLLLNLNQGRQPHAQGRGHIQPWNNERHGRIQHVRHSTEYVATYFLRSRR